MHKLLTVFIDVLFPPSAEETIIKNTTKEVLTMKYRPGLHSNITFLSHYHDPVIGAAIRQNKFHHSTKAALLLAQLLKLHEAYFDTKTLFVPIPLGRKRLRERGHNQIMTVLEVANLTKQTQDKLLTRVHETTPQSRLTKDKRMKNIKDAFYFSGKTDDFKGYQKVILIDDVVTTGATMRAAKKVLESELPKHCKLTCVTLAH